MMKTGVDLIAIERKRQIEELGFDYTNDALYANEELSRAGAAYATPEKAKIIWDGSISSYIRNHLWPWDKKYYKPSPDDRIKELAKAGALIAAQIDYLQNKTNISIK